MVYKPHERATLKIGKAAFDVADISEMGLRFFDDQKEIGQYVQGTLTLLCGESIDIEGMVVRKQQADIYMTVKPPLQRKILQREQKHIGDT